MVDNHSSEQSVPCSVIEARLGFGHQQCTVHTEATTRAHTHRVTRGARPRFPGFAPPRSHQPRESDYLARKVFPLPAPPE
ncbi:hypothetical protein NDU88_003186 [Pleurodeles waltl]|uniref:Uncharacterized protein n=1 Tax=Pleurodeles waltl TaxID=8319 RepID=A0AAV7V0L4_PLEWA|nr:hypothetical protein NDU88_003186 [Pleurodeles waltl]